WPAIVQVLGPAGPLSVSTPEPPSNARGTGADASEASTVNVSLPSPPLTVRLDRESSAFDSLVPSIVTTRLPPLTAAETLCAEPLAAPTDQGAAAVTVCVADVVAAALALVVDEVS